MPVRVSRWVHAARTPDVNHPEPRMYCPKCDLEFWAKNVVGDRCVFCGSAGIEDVKDRPRKGFNRRIEEPPDDDR